MSTNSSIIQQTAKGAFKKIYCHWDGDIAGVGTTLDKYYRDDDKINKLINLGDISILGNDLNPIPFSKVNERTKNQTCAYHRDRGEELCINTFNDFSELIAFKDCLEEYTYIHMDNEWYYLQKLNGSKYSLKNLKEMINEERTTDYKELEKAVIYASEKFENGDWFLTAEYEDLINGLAEYFQVKVKFIKDNLNNIFEYRFDIYNNLIYYNGDNFYDTDIPLSYLEIYNLVTSDFKTL
ncbi:hypothetical protein [Apilactobacillus timberlakei]|uniref:hypothetical protein n=1 Tax=Apilactobacillus timberlakei TaxID=2008380 RepID=UPI00112AF1C7|nr:hypothetical protein [Apilactobacillus timberlakei]TPR16769.1 hypothetical protein DYZ95_07245 [Apilactobacillus timberlakei]TPR21532.1 hypothetical protein DY083_05795 [Apilactobacillus timberlakei]